MLCHDQCMSHINRGAEQTMNRRSVVHTFLSAINIVLVQIVFGGIMLTLAAWEKVFSGGESPAAAALLKLGRICEMSC